MTAIHGSALFERPVDEVFEFLADPATSRRTTPWW
jgi:hypothetical protein